MDPGLYVVYLGGDPAPGRVGEDHEVVVVVATDVVEARKAARSKWGGQSRPHVDAAKSIGDVDGYLIHLEPTDIADSDEVGVTYESPDGSSDS